MELSVIIVSYNVKAYLEQCLYSLRRATESIAAEVWVVDNASSDGTVASLPEAFPEVHWMPLEENIGYGRANNRVLASTTGKYVLFLNPDTLLEEDALQKCLAYMDTREDAGALGVRMINGFGAFLGESKRGMPGVMASFFKMAGLAERFPTSAFFSGYYAGHLDPRVTNAVPVLSGAFMLVRREVIRDTEGFDERFFMFGEDIDLSYRIRKAGWNNYYFAGTVLVHFKGQSTEKTSDQYLRHFFGAMNLFVRKYYPGALSFFYRQLLQAGILLQKTRTRFFPPGPRHWTPETARQHWLLVGSGKDIRAFLKRYDPGSLFYLTLDTDRADLENIQQHMGLDGGTPVLFCMGDLRYGPVIEWMDRAGWEAPCFFHHRQSGSIVGPGKEWPVPFHLRPPA